MTRGYVFGGIGAAFSAVSIALGLYYNDAMMVVLSLLALCYCIVSLKYGNAGLFVTVASMIVMVCTILVTIVFSYDSMVTNGTMEKIDWSFIINIIQTVAVIPLTVLTFFIIAKVSEASYNWVMIGGFTPFIGLGIMGIGYALTYIFLLTELNDVLTDNVYILYGAAICLITHIVIALILGSIFKKRRYLITSNGLEVQP